MIIVNGKKILTTIREFVNPKHTALLLIDLQNDFMMPGGHFDKLTDCSALRMIIPRVKDVLESARRSRVLVVHVQMTFYPDFLAQSPVALYKQLVRIGDTSADAVNKIKPYCIDGTWGWQIVDALAPLQNEVIVRKHRSSAFMGTDLDMILRSNGIQSVVAAGVVTQACVMSTIDDAPFFEYYPVLVSDAVASRNQKLHDAAMLLMSNKNNMIESHELIAIWQKSSSA